MTNIFMKDVQHNYPIGKFKLKSKGGNSTTTHLSEWL